MAKKTKYHQGQYIPKDKKKYCGSYPIIYRSSWERKFLSYLDLNESVLAYSSESIIVPYYHPFKKRVVRYFPDFYVRVKDKKGKVTEYLIEVKPDKETRKPVSRRGKRAKTLLYEQCTWKINSSKWLFAEQFCRQRGWVFKLLTERERKI